MIFNISKRNQIQDKEIEQMVGAPYSLFERIKMGGCGSPTLVIDEVSRAINELWGTDSDIRRCNVELRPKGLIIRFKSKIEDYAWVIPYHQLSIYQNGKQWSFHSSGQLIKAKPTASDKHNRSFLLKMMSQRTALHASPF